MPDQQAGQTPQPVVDQNRLLLTQTSIPLPTWRMRLKPLEALRRLRLEKWGQTPGCSHPMAPYTATEDGNTLGARSMAITGCFSMHVPTQFPPELAGTRRAQEHTGMGQATLRSPAAVHLPKLLGSET